jgi:hypothetical protein
MALIKPEQLRSGSYEISGSFSGSFQGDGSGLNNITASLAPNYVLTSSYIQDSSSFDTRILNNSSSIDLLSGSFDSFTQTYNTGSFSGSFHGDGSGLNNITASIAPQYTLTSSFNAFTSSYIQDSASFDTRILSNSSSIYILSGSFIGFSGSYVNDSSSFDTRILANSSSLSTFSGSYVLDSASFDMRILSNSSSIDLLSGSFDSFTQTYNTSSFTGSFTGSLFGTASWAINAQTASYVLPLNQDVLISGSLKFDPTQDPDPSGLDLDSTVLFQSSSNTTLGYDLYVRQNGNLVKWKWVEGILNTGLLYGGVVTYSGTDVFVSPGSGIIVNHNATTGSEISPIIEYVTWPAITQSITNIATQQVTYLYIDNAGALQQQSSRFTNEQYHDYIPLGAIGHFDYTQVSAFGGQVQTAYDQIAQISSFVDAFGPLKISGYGLTGQPGTLRLSVGSGTSFIHGGFYEEDPELPSQITTPAQATASMAYVYRSGSGVRFDTNGGNLYTQLNPGFYDPGTGVTGSVSNNDWTIQRVYTDPKTGVLYVYFGQTIYPDFLTAVADLSTDPFTEGDTFDFTTFIGFLVLKSNGTDITAADNKIVPAGLFRGSGQGSGGGVAISNLDDLTDVSITGPTNGEALIYDSGIWQNGTPLNATSASFALSGNGIFSGSFSGSGANLFNIPASGIVGLNLSQIASGSVSASISPTTGLQVNTNVTAPAFSGSFSGSFQGDGSVLNNVTASLSPDYTLTSSFNSFTSSYVQDSASFDTRILSNSSSVSILSSSFENFSGSYVTDSSSFDTRITSNSSSISTLSGSFIGFSGSYVTDSSSFDTRILNNSSSISILSGSFESFTQTYNTGSFTGSFTGDGSGLYNISASGIVGLNLSQISSGSVSASISPDSGLQVNTNVTAPSFTGSLFGTASWAENASTASYVVLAQTASYVLNAVSSSFASTASYTPNAITTASIAGDTITFTKGNGSTFPIIIPASSDPAGWTTIVKSANQDVTNSVTLVNDTDLQFSVVAGGHYMVEMNLCWSCNSTSGPYRWRFFMSSGGMAGSGNVRLYTTATAIFNANFSAATNIQLPPTPIGNIDFLNFADVVFNFYADTNATVSLQFANGGAAAGKISRTWKGSILKYKRID